MSLEWSSAGGFPKVAATAFVHIDGECGDRRTDP